MARTGKDAFLGIPAVGKLNNHRVAELEKRSRWDSTIATARIVGNGAVGLMAQVPNKLQGIYPKPWP